MLENPTPAAAAPPPDSTTIKRYAPPNQRTRSLNRRKSGDRFDRGNSVYPNDGEKNQQQAHGNPPRNNNIPVVDHGDAGSSSLLNANFRPILIPLEGCCRSDASQLLNDRWAATMHNYNDTSIDLSERPVMYSGSSSSAWGQFKLPHQITSPVNSVGAHSPQMDFLSELRHAIQNAKASYEK